MNKRRKKILPYLEFPNINLCLKTDKNIKGINEIFKFFKELNIK